MQLDFIPTGDTLTVALRGELDHHTAGAIREKIDTAVLSRRCRRLVLDFSGLTFMDSSGIGLIMGRYRLMGSLAGGLTVSGASPRLESIMRLAGLEKLPIWNTQERKEPHETHQ